MDDTNTNIVLMFKVDTSVRDEVVHVTFFLMNEVRDTLTLVLS